MTLEPRSAAFASAAALVLLLFAAPSSLAGQTPLEPGLAELGLLPGRPRVTPPRTNRPPSIDGVLDDEVWATAAHITEFTHQSPFEGEPASEATDVYIAYNSDYIYFGFHVHYVDPSIMRANRVDRDRVSYPFTSKAPSPIASPPSGTRTGSVCWNGDGSSSSGPTKSSWLGTGSMPPFGRSRPG